MTIKKIVNTYNFFEINDQDVLFWGLNIPSRLIPITNKVERLLKNLDLPSHEVIEIYDDKSLRFFKEIYPANM